MIQDRFGLVDDVPSDDVIRGHDVRADESADGLRFPEARAFHEDVALEPGALRRREASRVDGRDFAALDLRSGRSGLRAKRVPQARSLLKREA